MNKYIFLLLFCVSPVLAEEFQFKKTEERVRQSASLHCYDYPDIENLDRKFLCQDNILLITKELYKDWSNADKNKAISGLTRLWDMGNPSSSTYEVEFSIVSLRLNIISLIGQSVRYSKQDTKCLSSYRLYALKQFSTGDTFVKIDALNAIGWIGNNQDIELLKKVILSEREGVAEKAVMSWQVLAPETFEVGILELEENLSRYGLKSFIESRVAEMK